MPVLRNSQHEHFAHLIAQGARPAKAYVLCGYSEKGALQSGHRLLRQGDVFARVEELKAAVSERQTEKIALDRAWVVAMLVENAKRAMQAEPVRDHQGHPTGEYTYQGAVANKALELLGKELGMFQTKPQSGSVDIVALLHAGRERARVLARKSADSDSSTLPC